MVNIYARYHGTFRFLVITSFLVFLFSLLIGFASAQPRLSFNPLITSGLSSPLDIVNAGDGSNRLFIVQRGGAIRIYKNGGLVTAPFLNIPDTIVSGGERGLLSLAFHPDYENNRYFYVWYNRAGTGNVTLARYRTSLANPDSAMPNSGVEMISLPKPGGQTNHNGAKLNFGTDGYLYIGTGDGGGGGDPSENAQDSNDLMGKMLRIDVSNFDTPPYYTSPDGNPYTSNPNIRDEIWAFGLRNPWRWSFDRLTGDMWIADVGQGLWEEVNVRTPAQSAGTNYGWDCYEGTASFEPATCRAASFYTPPIFAYPHDNMTGGFSVTGGYVYRGPGFPLLTGYYIMADHITGRLWLINPNGSGGWNVYTQAPTAGSGQIAGFGEAEDGTLYAVSLAGAVYTVEANSLVPVQLLEWKANWVDDDVRLSWLTTREENFQGFEIEFSRDGLNFIKQGSVYAKNLPNGSTYSFDHKVPGSENLFYRLKMIDRDGRFEYSWIVSLKKIGITQIYPTIIENGVLNISINEPYDLMQVVNLNGQRVLQRTLNGQTGNISISLPATLKPATYLVQLLSKEKRFQQKIIIR